MPPLASPEMRAYYAARAPYYDDVYLKPERAEDLAFLQTYLPQRLEGRDVLEVACGTGFWTQHIARTARRVAATDWTAEPLEFARLRPHTECVSYLQADAYDLPASLGHFNAAFAGLWFSHVPIEARARFFSSLHSRLTDGAHVFLLDNSDVQRRDFPIEAKDAWGNNFQLRTLRDGSTHRVLKNFPSQQELDACVADVGHPLAFRQLQNFWLFEYQIKRAA